LPDGKRSGHNATDDFCTIVTTFISLCQVASIAFGFIAAWYWYKASTKKVTTRDNNPNPNPGVELLSNPDSEGHRVLYTSTAIEQSKLNATAAKYTAVMVGFQAIAILVDALR
jgi:hypothetical protein